MSASGKKRSRLVAEKRYPKVSAGKKKKPAKKRVSRARKLKPRRSRNWLVAIVSGLFGWIFRLVWRLSVRGGLALAALLAVAVFYFYATLPDVTELLDGRARGSVTMLDRNGAVFAWRGEQFGGQITANTVSPHLRNAVVATEDKRFYRHFGISPRGVASAVRINLGEGRGPLSGHGGSTITQQAATLL